jgi:ABC-type Fe3+/spermidine/putrescine transport system ATPase subunit
MRDVGRAAAAVRLERLSKSFDGVRRAVDGVDLAIEAGEFFALLGPSGCGKTTTLRMIAGFETPDEGRIHVGGVDVTAVPVHRRNMGMIFQSYALFPHRTVAENVAFGLRMRGLPRRDIAEAVWYSPANRKVKLAPKYDARLYNTEAKVAQLILVDWKWYNERKDEVDARINRLMRG